VFKFPAVPRLKFSDSETELQLEFERERLRAPVTGSIPWSPVRSIPGPD
jgi:hypothetical protein